MASGNRMTIFAVLLGMRKNGLLAGWLESFETRNVEMKQCYKDYMILVKTAVEC